MDRALTPGERFEPDPQLLGRFADQCRGDAVALVPVVAGEAFEQMREQIGYGDPAQHEQAGCC